MTTRHCPDCFTPVDVPPHAREGRCDDCRPRRRHSVPGHMDAGSSFSRFVAEHQRAWAYV